MEFWAILKVLALGVLVTCSLVSCKTEVDPNLMTPREANKYELVMYYQCEGKTVWAWNGQGGCQYEPQNLTIYVKTPPGKGTVVAKSTRMEKVISFKDKAWVPITMNLEGTGDSVPVVISVSSELGNQLGKFFPYVTDPIYPKMEGNFSFFCYQENRTLKLKGMGYCQQPAGSKISGNFDMAEEGEYLITVEGCELSKPAVKRGTGPKGPLSFTVTKGEAGFCYASVAVKYISGKIAESEIYFDFFDLKYTSLPKPEMTDKGSKVEGCRSDKAQALEVNQKNPTLGKCAAESWMDGNWGYAVSWDLKGRLSYETKVKGK